MSRREFSAKTKALAFERARGHCEGCTAKLFTGRIEYDHELPDALGGEPTLENCRVLCRFCHSEKTAMDDVPRIAKAKRVYRRHVGIKKASQLACSKDSRWKKKLDGSVVRR